MLLYVHWRLQYGVMGKTFKKTSVTKEASPDPEALNFALCRRPGFCNLRWEVNRTPGNLGSNDIQLKKVKETNI